MRLLIFILLVAYSSAASSDLQCTYPIRDLIQDWILMTDRCVQAIRSMINNKMNLAIQYLALGNMFLQVQYSRPGYADMFIRNSRRSRSEAIDLIDYLNMRGQNTRGKLFSVELNYVPPVTEWPNLVSAIEYTVIMEANSTNLLNDVIETCENQSFKDHHVSNWLSRVYLNVQYNNEKWFIGLVSALTKLIDQHGNLGEFISDNTMQERNSD